MKAYYYFLFRIYRYYKDKQKENEFEALFSATAVSTVIIYFILLLIYGFANYYSLVPMIKNKMYVIPTMIIIGILNYLFFVRSKEFLNFNFQKDKKGGINIVIFIIFLLTLFIIFANINRKKIFEERRINPIVEKTETRKSLIGDIVKWFEKKY